MDQCLTSADVQESSSPYAQKHGFKCVFYKCPICQKEVARKDGLRRHVERHMGRYQYYCKQCNKGFMSSTTYRGHMAKHTGIKEFQCSQCNLCFAYKRQLQTHEAKIHGQILTLSARSDDSWPWCYWHTSRHVKFEFIHMSITRSIMNIKIQSCILAHRYNMYNGTHGTCVPVHCRYSD